METLLVYIHIPKTAGSTFKKLINSINTDLTDWYPGKGTNSWNSPGCLDAHKYGGTGSFGNRAVYTLCLAIKCQ